MEARTIMDGIDNNSTGSDPFAEYATRLFRIMGKNPNRFFVLSFCKQINCETPIVVFFDNVEEIRYSLDQVGNEEYLRY